VDDFFNNRRLLKPIGNQLYTDFEANHHAARETEEMAT
jgi:hypothetical protein